MEEKYQPAEQHLNIKEAAAMLQVSVDTLRRWDKEGRLQPAGRTVTGWRYYFFTDIQKILSDLNESHKASCMQKAMQELLESVKQDLSKLNSSVDDGSSEKWQDSNTLLSNAKLLVQSIEQNDRKKTLIFLSRIAHAMSNTHT